MPSPCRNRAATNSSIDGASPASSSPNENPPTDASRGRFGPLRSAHIPPATMPTTLAASVTEKAAENQARPSRSALTVGMIVVTASASNAARKTRLTMPIVAQR